MEHISKAELKVVEFLVRNFNEKSSINEIARRVGLSPMGCYKPLKKLESQGILVSEKIGNGIFYRINFANERAKELSKLVLAPAKMPPFLRVLSQDISELQGAASAVIIFGSVVSRHENARDIDILLLLDKRKLKDAEIALKKIQARYAKDLHPVFQTKNDFANNLKKRDLVALNALKQGVVLWGRDAVLSAVMEAQK